MLHVVVFLLFGAPGDSVSSENGISTLRSCRFVRGKPPQASSRLLSHRWEGESNKRPSTTSRSGRLAASCRAAGVAQQPPDFTLPQSFLRMVGWFLYVVDN